MGLDMFLYRQDTDNKKEEILYLRKCYTVRRWIVERIALHAGSSIDDIDFYAESVCPLDEELTRQDLEYVRDKCYEYLQDKDLNELVKKDDHTNKEFSDWQVLYTYMVIKRSLDCDGKVKWKYEDVG